MAKANPRSFQGCWRSRGRGLGPESLERIKAIDVETLPLVEGNPRLGAPIGLVPKFLGIGLNYRDHAEETGMPIPEVPIVFAKANSCVSGPDDPILAPKDFQRMDFEVELAVVIGTAAQNVARESRARLCGRLLHRQRRVRTQPAERRSRRMDQGEEP